MIVEAIVAKAAKACVPKLAVKLHRVERAAWLIRAAETASDHFPVVTDLNACAAR